MEFGIEKCAVQKIRRGRREIIEGVELTNLEGRTFGEKENYKYLGIFGYGKHQTNKDDRKSKKKEYLKKRKLLKINLSSRNLIKAWIL